jgi:hypothetical protein
MCSEKNLQMAEKKTKYVAGFPGRVIYVKILLEKGRTLT